MLLPMLQQVFQGHVLCLSLQHFCFLHGETSLRGLVRLFTNSFAIPCVAWFAGALACTLLISIASFALTEDLWDADTILHPIAVVANAQSFLAFGMWCADLEFAWINWDAFVFAIFFDHLVVRLAVALVIFRIALRQSGANHIVAWNFFAFSILHLVSLVTFTIMAVSVHRTSSWHSSNETLVLSPVRDTTFQPACSFLSFPVRLFTP